MKSLILIGILLASLSVFAQKFSKEEEAYLKKIQSDYKSEKYRYDYAEFLFFKDRFTDAQGAIKVLLKFYPENNEAKRLKELIVQIKGTKVAEERQKIKSKFVEDKMQQMADTMRQFADTQRAIASKNDPALAQKMEQEAKQKEYEFDRKYGISNQPDPYLITIQEMLLALNAKRYEAASQYPEAEAVHSERMLNYPNSPAAVTDYIQYLVARDRMNEAEVYSRQNLGKFAYDPMIRFMNDYVPAINNAATLEKAGELKKEYLMDHLIITGVVTKMSKGQRLPSATQAAPPPNTYNGNGPAAPPPLPIEELPPPPPIPTN